MDQVRMPASNAELTNVEMKIKVIVSGSLSNDGVFSCFPCDKTETVYQCCLFPYHKEKLPYEAKWAFNDTARGNICNIYLKAKHLNAMKPIPLLKMESDDQQCDIGREIWQIVMGKNKSKEAFPLAARDVRGLIPKATTVPKSDSSNEEKDMKDQSPDIASTIASNELGDTVMASHITASNTNVKCDRLVKRANALQKDVQPMKPRWRYSIKRLGLKPNITKEQWTMMQLKALSYKMLYDSNAKFIVLSSTEKSLQYLYANGKYSPFLRNYQNFQHFLSTFTKQPIFVIFVKNDKAKSSRRIGAIGLVTSTLNRKDQERIGTKFEYEFHCDVISTAMPKQQWNESFKAGSEITREKGRAIIAIIKQGLRDNTAENSFPFTRQASSVPKNKQIFCHQNAKTVQMNTSSWNVARSPENIDNNNSTRDLPAEDWEEEIKENLKIIEKKNVANAIMQKENIDIKMLKKIHLQPKRDLRIEMEIFGLDSNDFPELLSG